MADNAENVAWSSADREVAGARNFAGTPALYRKIAIWGSIALHAYLFLGYWAIKVFLAGEAWPASWAPPAITLLSAAWFARFSYRWIMRLDARYGRGSNWEFDSVRDKLPRERSRKT